MDMTLQTDRKHGNDRESVPAGVCSYVQCANPEWYAREPEFTIRLHPPETFVKRSHGAGRGR